MKNKLNASAKKDTGDINSNNRDDSDNSTIDDFGYEDVLDSEDSELIAGVVQNTDDNLNDFENYDGYQNGFELLDEATEYPDCETGTLDFGEQDIEDTLLDDIPPVCNKD